MAAGRPFLLVLDGFLDRRHHQRLVAIGHQRPAVRAWDFLRNDLLLPGRGQLQQTDQVGDRRRIEAQLLGDLGLAGAVAGVEHGLHPAGPLDVGERVAAVILLQADLPHLPVGEFAELQGHRRPAQFADGPQAAFAAGDLEAVAGLAAQWRLEQALAGDQLGQLGNLLPGEMAAGLERVRVDELDRHPADHAAVRTPGRCARSAAAHRLGLGRRVRPGFQGRVGAHSAGRGGAVQHPLARLEALRRRFVQRRPERRGTGISAVVRARASRWLGFVVIDRQRRIGRPAMHRRVLVQPDLRGQKGEAPQLVG